MSVPPHAPRAYGTKRVIWKFPLPTDDCVIEMPVDATTVHVAQDPATRGQLAVWVLCSPTAPKGWRRFVALNTGDEVADENRTQFVGTTITPGNPVEGPLAWHVFAYPITMVQPTAAIRRTA